MEQKPAQMTFYFRVDPEVYKAVKKRAEKEGISMGKIISALVRKHLKEKK